MHSKCFHLCGDRYVYWYGIMAAFGFFVAMVHWSRLGHREGRAPGFGSDLAVWLMLSGLIGARLAYVLTNLSVFVERPWSVFRIDEGGLVFYGGFFGGCIGALVFARRRGLAVLPLGDFIVTGIPLGHTFGRLGCFLHGCCYGRPWDGPLAVRFPAGSAPVNGQIAHGLLPPDAVASLPVHPTQLYEAVFNAVLYAVLLWVYRVRRGTGRTLGTYLVGYATGRFLIELFRGDPRPHLLGLSFAQWICLVLLGPGLLLILRAGRSGRGEQLKNRGA